jgi:hypothetical protein
MSVRCVVAVSALSLSLLGCGGTRALGDSVTEETDPVGSTPSLGLTESQRTWQAACRAGADAAAPSPIRLKGSVASFPDGATLPKATVCATVAGDGSDPTCVLTDPQGGYELSIPSCSIVRLTHSLNEYLSANELFQVPRATSSGQTIEGGAFLFSRSYVASFEHGTGTALDPNKAHVATFSLHGAQFSKVVGATLDVRPSSGQKFYLGSDYVPSASLTATSTTGIGGVFNVDPGSLEVEFHPPPHIGTCTSAAYPGASQNTGVAEGLPGSVAMLLFYCD